MKNAFTKLSINKDYLSEKKILYAIVDETSLKDVNKPLHDMMFNVTNSFSIRMSTTTLKGEVRYYNNIDETMSKSDGYDIIVIQNIGNIIRINQFYEVLNDYCKDNPEFFIMAFTLDWESEHGEGWLQIHHQLMIVNRNTWVKLGKPVFGNWDNTIDTLPNYERSEENFHDKYTPYWIKGVPGSSEKLRKYPGWNFLKTALEHNMKIDNFPEIMRECRLYTYPESDSDKFYDAILTLDSTKVSNSNQKKYINSWLQSKPQVWIFNSESNKFDINLIGCDHYFGPAAGFKYLSALSGNEDIKFTLYDYNQQSLDWIKNLWENWDGEELEQFIKKQPLDVKRTFKYINNTIEDNINNLYIDFIGEERFKKLWRDFKSSSVTFVKIDLLNELSALENLLSITDCNKPVFYYSNIFSTDMLSTQYELDEIEEKRQQLVDTVTNYYPKAITYGANAIGNWIFTKGKLLISKTYG